MEADDMSLRVASFSCYLNNPEESLVQRIAGGSSEDLPRPDAPFPVRARASGLVEDPTVSFVFPSGNTAKHLERRVIGKSRKDGEISIFDADKYFNMKLDQKLDLACTAPIRSGKINKYKNEIPAVESPCTKPKSSTVSVCSEPTSSLGSKAVLLHNPKPRKAAIVPRSFFGRLGCQGRCLDKKAVVIDERGDHHGSKQADDSQKHSGNTTIRNCRHKQYDNNKQTVSSAKLQMEEEEQEEQRKSLEVFGAHKMRKGDVAVNLERKLSVLTWDAIPKTTTIGSNSNTICDDMASDASSDLFEIENISDSTKHGLMLASGCASPVTQYVPSEASITWSVVTAGAPDHSSVISDYDENSVSIVGGTIHRATASKTGKFKDVTGKSSPRTPFTGLLGCNSHGAVNISEAAHNTSDRRKLGKSIHNCHSPDDFSDHLHARPEQKCCRT